METDALVGAVPAQPWSLLLGQFGQFTIIVAVALNMIAAILYVLQPKNPKFEKAAQFAFSAGCVSFLVAFGVVITLFVKDQYQFKYVFDHGSSDNDLQYKVAGAWSGQEGSILLWGTASSIFGMISARFTKAYRRVFTIAYAPFLASVAAILAFESPFVLRPLIEGRAMVPVSGQGLSPSLLNYWVVIHPPTIFLGFGSLTVLFAFSIAALVTKDMDSWIPIVRPWTLLSLAILGVGLCMGGFWAYETLGWGGFWMWDPVENTSFVPWVAVAALVHGIIVQTSRQKWHYTNALLAGLPFLLFCYGTFLTRSGYLGDTSVHSFAEMDRSALWILMAIIGLGFIIFFTLWGVHTWKGKPLIPTPKALNPLPFNRELFMGVAIWLLVGFGIVTAIGMSIPFLQTITGNKPKVVDERLYNTVLSFLFIPFLIFMGIGPFLTWKGLGTRALLTRFTNIFAISVGLVGVALLWVKSDSLGLPADLTATATLLLKFQVNRVGWVMFLTWICLFGITATCWRLVEVSLRSKSSIGGMITHLGVGVAMLGLIFSRGLEQKSIDPVTKSPDSSAFVINSTSQATALGSKFRAIGPTGSFIDRKNKVKIEVTDSRGTHIVTPGLYFRGMDQSGQPMPFIWPSIQSHGLYDMYLVLHNLTFEASGPTEMKIGDQRLLKEENMLVTYKGMRTEGTPGQKGAKFFANVTIQTEKGQWDVEPMITLGEGGIEDHPAKAGDAYRISMVSMNAADKSATLQIKYAQPAYVAELFYKPLTLLVWLGVGIMGFGGLLTAWTRRVRSGVAIEPNVIDEEPTVDSQSQEERHAPQPAPQS